ncbi:hypothetical protein ACHQM5_013861 [Ranunculus cassubicifolius]
MFKSRAAASFAAAAAVVPFNYISKLKSFSSYPISPWRRHHLQHLNKTLMPCKSYCTISQTRPYIGTLKELDYFYNQDELHEASKVLELLERKGVMVNLPKYEDSCKGNGVMLCADLVEELDENCKLNLMGETISCLRKLEEKGVYVNIPKYLPLLFQNNGDAGILHCLGTIEEFDGFCKEYKVEEAFEVLKVLKKKFIHVDLERYVLLMKKIGDIQDLDWAKCFHDFFIRLGEEIETCVYHKIIEMYLKCGSLLDAYKVLESLPEHALETWNKMITDLAVNGYGREALDLFSQFHDSGMRPDRDTFHGVFLTCGVVGDIVRGMLHFESMNSVYGIVPSVEDYVSVVTMLGNAGCLDEAKEFIDKMPVDPIVDIWETLLNACRVHGNTELGDHCVEVVHFLDPSRLTDKQKEGLVPVKASDVVKEKNRRPHLMDSFKNFKTWDKSHPESDQIYALVRRLTEQIKEPPRWTTVRIMKNCRICQESHTALKFMSKVSGREIIIRESKRFHHMKDGSRSCNGFY